MTLLSTYIENAKLNEDYPLKTILVSEAVAQSQEVLTKLQQAGKDYLNTKLNVITITQTYYQDRSSVDLNGYIRQRFNSPSKENLSEKILSSCKTQRSCNLDILQNQGIFVSNTISSVWSILSSFKTTHASICGREHNGLCHEIKSTNIFYFNLHQKMADLASSCQVNGTACDLAFQQEGVNSVSAYQLHKVSNSESGTFTYEEVNYFDRLMEVARPLVLHLKTLWLVSVG